MRIKIPRPSVFEILFRSSSVPRTPGCNFMSPASIQSASPTIQRVTPHSSNKNLRNSSESFFQFSMKDDEVAGTGLLHVLKEKVQSRKPLILTAMSLERAAANGHLDTVKWLTKWEKDNYSLNVSKRPLERAAANGHLDVVKWLHENRSEGCSTTAMDSAAANGHLEVVEWLYKNRNEGCTHFALDMARRNGHLHVVQWLSENRADAARNKEIP